MKIKYAFPLLLVFFLGAFAEDCAYLKDPEKSVADDDYPGRFNYYYPYHLCEENNPIHTEAKEYLQNIKKIEGKTPGEVIHDIGDTFCRGYFCDPTVDSFYKRFLTSCETARTRAIESMSSDARDKKTSTAESISTDFLAGSYVSCPILAENYILAYKEVAVDEAGRYHRKTIESSSESYLTKSREEMNKLTGIWGTFLKIFGNISRSFQGFTKQVYNA